MSLSKIDLLKLHFVLVLKKMWVSEDAHDLFGGLFKVLGLLFLIWSRWGSVNIFGVVLGLEPFQKHEIFFFSIKSIESIGFRTEKPKG